MALLNKVAIVTGASKGIGRAIATTLAREGVDLFLIARNPEKLKNTVGSLSKLFPERTISYGTFDLSDEKQIIGLVEVFQGEFAQLDILVNNAGMGQFIPFEDSGPEVLRKHLKLNVEAPFFLAHAFLPMLKESKGNVINISSYFAERMLPGRTTTAYSTTKGAINSFTRAAAFELGRYGIRVNAVSPGTVVTDIVKQNLERLTKESVTRFREMINEIYPLQRLGNPEEIAELVAFIASERASWITGGIFPVDGGLTTN
jgi:NAD(P)-dependent dehydrogenase (short-subunit alcohol dehydrogenase family)